MGTHVLMVVGRAVGVVGVTAWQGGEERAELERGLPQMLGRGKGRASGRGTGPPRYTADQAQLQRED